MQIYKVGGAVRDLLRGDTPKDIDYVVVGGNVAGMLAAGYTQVGADFPVFLHPQTNEEYALARVERKSAAGYHGFTVNTEGVSLEDDLSRRDLTINAMAMDSSGAIIDPYNGQSDLTAKVLRHVSIAFTEDPLRVLRLARFLARFGASWTIAPETRQLVSAMVLNGELNSLTKERVWVEVKKGLTEPYPELMVEFLRDLGVFELPGFEDYTSARYCDLQFLGKAASNDSSLNVRAAIVLNRSWTTSELKQSRIPSDVREVVQAYHRTQNFTGIAKFAELVPSRKLELLESLDVMRRPACFDSLCQIFALHDEAISQSLQKARACFRTIDQRAISLGKTSALEIQQAIRQARLLALETS